MDPDYTVKHMEAVFLIFLGNVFDHIRNILEEHFRGSASDFEALSTSWRSYLESNREQLYWSIVDASKQSLTQRLENIETEVCSPRKILDWI